MLNTRLKSVHFDVSKLILMKLNSTDVSPRDFARAENSLEALWLQVIARGDEQCAKGKVTPAAKAIAIVRSRRTSDQNVEPRVWQF
jgi:hypothetical protein